MRKVFWCCGAAGAAVCCAFWAAAYVSQNPDSPLGRCALAACPVSVGGVATSACRRGQVGGVDIDDLVPPDPVPVDDEPLPPTPGSHVPAEVAALMAPPPIVIHDEEDLNAASGPIARTEPSTGGPIDVECLHPSTVDFDDLARGLDGDAEPSCPTGPPTMPYCTDDAGAGPTMPYCTEEDQAPTMAPAGQADARKVNSAPAYREFDAAAFWMGFFAGPTHAFDGAANRCEEDAHYPQHYAGCPYTGAECPPVQAPPTDVKPLPAFPGAEEPSEPPAPKNSDKVDPANLFSHPRHLQMPRPSESQSDTMEMRPSDFKPYSLDPGPF